MLDARPVLRLAVPTWLNVAAIAAAVDALAGIRIGLREAYAAVDASALRDGGSPYRPQLDDAQVTAQRSALANEVAAVAGLRVKR